MREHGKILKYAYPAEREVGVLLFTLSCYLLPILPSILVICSYHPILLDLNSLSTLSSTLPFVAPHQLLIYSIQLTNSSLLPHTRPIHPS
ncbi:hypothetical protein SS1G_08550 [Sclerotinia sclerotiorum 1980 UF-70]|uniref:Uncharacterized protein n=1 Tax=Sclerotinia sclerotiorum (strain ATCC 18683 / 1980 / Ss-1) TaxID=665079 RepID=A7ET95_SCLS1|nr:hypothetical protein SS1G_08550 [Sclerotinia sclerotiorum 1980 UF-70]EDN92687.1 hypothetical protein SS1G_08550 [Sclerotinia sclerotiorum 1980 UF-70]